MFCVNVFVHDRMIVNGYYTHTTTGALERGRSPIHGICVHRCMTD